VWIRDYEWLAAKQRISKPRKRTGDIQMLLQLKLHTFCEPLTLNCPNIPREMEFVRCPLLMWTVLFGHYFTVPWAPSSQVIAFPPLLPILFSNCLQWISSVQGGEWSRDSAFGVVTVLRYGLDNGEMGPGCRYAQGIFLFSTAFRRAWKPTQPLGHWVPAKRSTRGKAAGASS
jgi:hypothetical protein